MRRPSRLCRASQRSHSQVRRAWLLLRTVRPRRCVRRLLRHLLLVLPLAQVRSLYPASLPLSLWPVWPPLCKRKGQRMHTWTMISVFEQSLLDVSSKGNRSQLQERRAELLLDLNWYRLVKHERVASEMVALREAQRPGNQLNIRLHNSTRQLVPSTLASQPLIDPMVPRACDDHTHPPHPSFDHHH